MLNRPTAAAVFNMPVLSADIRVGQTIRYIPGRAGVYLKRAGETAEAKALRRKLRAKRSADRRWLRDNADMLPF